MVAVRRHARGGHPCQRGRAPRTLARRFVSVASLVVWAVVTAAAASDAPAGRVARLVVVVVVVFACVGTYAFLWLAQLAVCRRVPFRTSPDGAAGTPLPEADGGPGASPHIPARS